METVKRRCKRCSHEQNAAKVHGLAGVAMWQMNCPRCGASGEGFCHPDECAEGEAYAENVDYGA